MPPPAAAPAPAPRRTRASGARLSPTVRPPDLDLVSWQRALRVQAGEEASFRLRHLGEHVVFGPFTVTNPTTRASYRVAIRGEAVGANYCSCADFARNRLGICKHIAFVLHRLRRQPHVMAQLARGYRPAYSELAVAYDGPPRLRLWRGADCPAPLHRLANRLADADGFVPPEGDIARLAATAAASGHELRIYDDARALLARAADARHRRDRLYDCFPGAAADPATAAILPGLTLHPYQCEGAWFLAERGRALLADDMGLGKTAQAMAAARLLGKAIGSTRFLVVAPPSLVGQWREELARGADLAAQPIRGTFERRAAAWRSAGDGWYLTTYDLLARDRESIARWGPDVLILDEAQRIKNWPTRAAQAVRRLDTPHVFVLTGTPVENKLDELHALVEVVDPFCLGPLPQFKARHSRADPATGKIVGYEGLDAIAAALQPVLLRRTRAQVMTQLPGRICTVLREPMTSAQRQIHEEARCGLAQLLARWQRLHYLSEQDQNLLRALLMRMRMVCDDAFLVDPGQQAGRKLAQVRRLLDEELRERGTKVVVFSAWLDMHALLRPMIEGRGWSSAFLHGAIPAAQRPAVLRTFREDPACRVFLSTDCGAVGLNLQCASVLINVDLPWNPATREQRISRIHRQGQRRSVRVYDLVAEDGIEAAIEQLLTFKSSLAAGILDGGPASVQLDSAPLQRMMRTVTDLDQRMAARAGTETATGPAATAPGERPLGSSGKATPGTSSPIILPSGRTDAAAASPATLSPTAGAPDSGASPPPVVPASAAAPASSIATTAALLRDMGSLLQGLQVDSDAEGRPCLRVPLADPGLLARLAQGLGALQASLTPAPPGAHRPQR